MEPGSPEFEKLLDEIEREGENRRWFIRGIRAGFQMYDDPRRLDKEKFNQWVRQEFADLRDRNQQ